MRASNHNDHNHNGSTDHNDNDNDNNRSVAATNASNDHDNDHNASTNDHNASTNDHNDHNASIDNHDHDNRSTDHYNNHNASTNHNRSTDHYNNHNASTNAIRRHVAGYSLVMDEGTYPDPHVFADAMKLVRGMRMPDASYVDAQRQHVVNATSKTAWKRTHASEDGEAWRAHGLTVIWSIAIELDERTWLHVSASRKDHVPSYHEMKAVHALFVGDRDAFSIWPKSSDHVNIHSYCLHMWCALTGGDPLPDFTHGMGTI